MIVGDADIWSDTFPEDLVPRVLDLITDTWTSFAHPGPNDLEVPTTRRFKHALKQAKDFNGHREETADFELVDLADALLPVVMRKQLVRAAEIERAIDRHNASLKSGGRRKAVARGK